MEPEPLFRARPDPGLDDPALEFQVALDVGLGSEVFIRGSGGKITMRCRPSARRRDRVGRTGTPRRARSAATGVVRAGWPKKSTRRPPAVVVFWSMTIPTGRFWSQVSHDPLHALLFAHHVVAAPLPEIAGQPGRPGWSSSRPTTTPGRQSSP